PPGLHPLHIVHKTYRLSYLHTASQDVRSLDPRSSAYTADPLPRHSRPVQIPAPHLPTSAAPERVPQALSYRCQPTPLHRHCWPQPQDLFYRLRCPIWSACRTMGSAQIDVKISFKGRQPNKESAAKPLCRYVSSATTLHTKRNVI